MSSLIEHAPEADRAGVLIPWFEETDRPANDRIAETSGLVAALGCELGFISENRIRNKSPSHLISAGILDNFKQNLIDNKCNIAIIDGSLSPIQQRNLERALNKKVIDRTGLILEIFGLRARTKEGVLQVELARLNYERSRLVRTWTHLERQRGGRGFLGGPGETQLESDKRMLDRTLKNLRRDLKNVTKTRVLQRAGRRKQGTPVIALVGYTNAGKSTLFNKLSGADVLAKDMPFATLDPTIRYVELPNIGNVAIVDTVGFITDLPTHLIDSFKATLEEALEADLLIHVRDRSSASDTENHKEVLSILEQLEKATGIDLPPIIEAWNKADLLTDAQLEALSEAASDDHGANASIISAMNGVGLKQLVGSIEALLIPNLKTYRITLNPADGRARAWLHQHAIVKEETLQEDTILIVAEMNTETYAMWNKQFEKETNAKG